MDGIQKHEIHITPPDLIVRMAALALGVLALWGLVQVLTSFKEYRFIGSGTTATNTIVVSGAGDVSAPPDIATFSVAVQEEAKAVKDAQDIATKKTNDIVGYLKGAGIAEKDIKTTGYDVYPQYDWVQGVCTNGYCPNGRQVLRGYQVSQSIQVKVRDLEKAGDVLTGVGSRGASNVSGLSLTIEDEDTLKAQARQKAIDDAEGKAKELARQLGVELVRIVGFDEGSSGVAVPMYAKAMAMDTAAGRAESAPAPEIPTGENKITSNVTITYEIR